MTDRADPGAMDPLSAHLERGWELLGQGDLGAATRAAGQAAACDGDSPEVATLHGAIAAAEGHVEQALAHYQEAIELDPEYASPILLSAELHLYALDDAEEARDLCQQALEVTDDDDDFTDGVLLLAESELALGEPEEARRAIAELDGVTLAEPDFHCRAGGLYLELDDLARATTHFAAALELDGELADAHYGLGRVCEVRGDRHGMIAAWQKTRALDLAEAYLPWHLDPDEFERIAAAALAELPERARAHLENVPILAADYPAEELVGEGYDPRMLGFFSGVPYPEKSNVTGAVPHPDCVYLYQRNIEGASRGAEELAEEIRITLLHETAHFFGLDDDDLGAMGLG